MTFPDMSEELFSTFRVGDRIMWISDTVLCQRVTFVKTGCFLDQELEYFFELIHIAMD